MDMTQKYKNWMALVYIIIFGIGMMNILSGYMLTSIDISFDGHFMMLTCKETVNDWGFLNTSEKLRLCCGKLSSTVGYATVLDSNWMKMVSGERIFQKIFSENVQVLAS